MKGRLLTLSALALALALACVDQKAPTGPTGLNAPTDPSAIISDGAHGGNPDFFFLPPLVSNPVNDPNFEVGKANNALEPSLTVEICELTSQNLNAQGLPTGATDCVAGPPVKKFPAGTVRLQGSQDDGFYQVLWNTRESNLDLTKYYRIKVFIQGSSVPLGVADVDPMSNMKEFHNARTGEVIPLLDDSTLPIKFRIERGALCNGATLCNSVTVTNNNPTGSQLVTVDGGAGAIAGATFPNGWLPLTGPQSVVVTIGSVNTGATNPATGTETIPCHANLSLQQFRGCFNFTTTPALAPIDESGTQFATPVTVAVCYVLQGTGDPREKFAEMWASGPNEPPHALPDASDAGILGANARNCTTNVIGVNNSKGVTGLASAGWRKLKGGLGRVFGVETAYAVDLGLGGFAVEFSNIGPALSARINPVGATQLILPSGGTVQPFVRIVGSNHHDGEHQNATGLGGIPVTFVTSSPATLSPQGTEGGTATQLTAITNTNPIDGSPTSGGGYATVNWTIPNTPGTYTLTANGLATGGPVTFTATVTTPFINFENYPAGAGVCDGQGACSVTNEFASRGVVFSFSNPDQTASLCRTIHGPVGEGSNYGVSPPSTDCTGWISGFVTMSFASHPTTVEFTLEGNNSGAEGQFPVTAFDPSGNLLTVTRSSVVTYLDQFEQTFRRETRRVTSPNRIASVTVDSNGAVRIIDNLLIVP